jgi:hypothetical protein
MTPEEQEAQSRKYAAFILLPLSSGAWALFTPDRKLVYIGDDPLSIALQTSLDSFGHSCYPSKVGDGIDLLKELGL